MNVMEFETLAAIKGACREYTNKEINWEQRQYEVAKDLYCKAIVNLTKLDIGLNAKVDAPNVAATCIAFADAFIDELKKHGVQ